MIVDENRRTYHDPSPPRAGESETRPGYVEVDESGSDTDTGGWALVNFGQMAES